VFERRSEPAVFDELRLKRLILGVELGRGLGAVLSREFPDRLDVTDKFALNRRRALGRCHWSEEDNDGEKQ